MISGLAADQKCFAAYAAESFILDVYPTQLIHFSVSGALFKLIKSLQTMNFHTAIERPTGFIFVICNRRCFSLTKCFDAGCFDSPTY